MIFSMCLCQFDGGGFVLLVFSFKSDVEFSEVKRKCFFRLLEEEIYNLFEGKDFENMRKVIKNVVVIFLVYWNKVKLEDEWVKNIELLDFEEGIE